MQSISGPTTQHFGKNKTVRNFLPEIMQIIESRIIIWKRYVARTRHMRILYKICIRMFKETTPLVRNMHRYEECESAKAWTG
jgi:hypothetical protein